MNNKLSLVYLLLIIAPLLIAYRGPAVKESKINASASPTKILKSVTANATTTFDVEPGATNIIYQSKDGGQTWQDISDGLPEYERPEGFFAGESDVYLRVNDVMYRSKSNLRTPVWEKENVLDAG